MLHSRHHPEENRGTCDSVHKDAPFTSRVAGAMPIAAYPTYQPAGYGRHCARSGNNQPQITNQYPGQEDHKRYQACHQAQRYPPTKITFHISNP
jgi:hypothetical protein